MALYHLIHSLWVVNSEVEFHTQISHTRWMPKPSPHPILVYNSVSHHPGVSGDSPAASSCRPGVSSPPGSWFAVSQTHHGASALLSSAPPPSLSPGQKTTHKMNTSLSTTLYTNSSHFHGLKFSGVKSSPSAQTSASFVPPWSACRGGAVVV